MTLATGNVAWSRYHTGGHKFLVSDENRDSGGNNQIWQCFGDRTMYFRLLDKGVLGCLSGAVARMLGTNCHQDDRH